MTRRKQESYLLVVSGLTTDFCFFKGISTISEIKRLEHRWETPSSFLFPVVFWILQRKLPTHCHLGTHHHFFSPYIWQLILVWEYRNIIVSLYFTRGYLHYIARHRPNHSWFSFFTLTLQWVLKILLISFKAFFFLSSHSRLWPLRIIWAAVHSLRGLHMFRRPGRKPKGGRVLAVRGPLGLHGATCPEEIRPADDTFNRVIWGFVPFFVFVYSFHLKNLSILISLNITEIV